MKIMHVIESLDPGGAEKVLVDIINNLPSYFQPSVCCLKKSGAMAIKIKDKSIPIFELNRKNGNDYLIPFRLSKLFRQNDIDIVHAHNWNTFCESIIASQLSHIKRTIHTIHGHHFQYNDNPIGLFKKKIRHTIENMLGGLSFQVCAVSESVETYILNAVGLDEKKVKVIINGIETFQPIESKEEIRKQFGINDSDFVMCFVGRIAKVKNLEMLIESVPELAKFFSNIKLFVIGDGPEKQQLQYLCQNLGVDKIVKWLGYLEEPRKVLNACDLFILPSHYEGISIALLEAMATGLPAVVTDVGGNARVVDHGNTGIVIAPGQSSEIKTAVEFLIKHSDKRIQMGAKAKQRIKDHFSIEKMVQSYCSLYHGKNDHWMTV